MGAKVWGTAAVVIAAAAAAGAGIVTWEGRVWDEHAQDLGSYKEAPVKTVVFTETARTWRTRAFTVEVELLNGLKMVWQGSAEFGFGTKTTASLDLTQGIGAQIAADKSVEWFGDELVIETSMTGTVKPVVWRLNPITYRAPENALVCQAEAASITGEKSGQDIVARFVLGGWSCRTAEEIAANAPSTESMKDLRAEIRVGEKPIADFTFTSGPFVSGELSGDGTRAAFISARSAGPAPEGKDGKAAQCWDERVELSVTNPKAGGESASEIGLDLTITNLSEAFLTELQTATQETAVNPDAAFRVLGIWSRAFTKDGIALNLTDARYVRGKDAAHLKGAFAYKAADPNAQGQELARGASWGSFELAIPQALIAKQTAAVYTASGDLRLIDGVYQSKLEIFENACFVNGNYKGNPIALLSLF